MAPQHRRGGKHAVKDKDLTHTKYDGYNREQLLAAVKEAGCYVKDDKKSVMARKLVEHDQYLQNEKRRAEQERKEKEAARQREIKDAAKAQRDRRMARAKRNEVRGIRYERGEEVSSNSDDTDEDQNRCDAHKLTVTGGEALSDETWEDTCSKTTIRSENPPVHPGCRLQLFEWPYLSMPLGDLTSDPQSEQHPSKLAFAPLRLTTTTTCEKITLPGKTYPAGVDPDFVPILDPPTRFAARHGHMLGRLERAFIEPASAWATRTIVQGWNGRMYFSLPRQHDTKPTQLDAVYCRWHIQNTKLLHPTPGVTDLRSDRKRRFAQRDANKRKAVAEVFEASRWKPIALGYMPAYLDWEAGVQRANNEVEERTIENLWYVRFPGCDVPHYCFWSKQGEWQDPTVPDPLWSAETSAQQDAVEVEAEGCKFLPSKPFRVKKLTSVPTHNVASAQPKRFGTSLSSEEHDLVTYGLSFTLAKNRAFAISAGKEQAWTAFTCQLSHLYPSGELPRAPPDQSEEDVCLAEKIGAVLSGCEVMPYSGQEGWTRHDDDFWDIVCYAEKAGVLPTPDTDSSKISLDIYKANADEGETEALHRRDSMNVLPTASDQRIWAWLASISDTYPPHADPLSICYLDDEPISPLNVNASQTTLKCPFCSHDWHHMHEWERAAHMLSHSYISAPQRLTSTSFITATGVGIKRRHSLLSQRTLQSYGGKYGRGRKMVRVDSARSLVDEVVEEVVVRCKKAGRQRSPYSKEVRRSRNMGRMCGEGRGGRGWMLARRLSDWGTDDEHLEEDEMDVGDCDRGSVWFGDDEG